MGTVRRWTGTVGLIILSVLVGLASSHVGQARTLGGDGFGKRFALVVGNGAYENAQTLPNAVRDATRIAEELAELRFRVFKGTDLTKVQFERLVKDFRSASADADTVVFYYAGHGFQLDGLNHLVPVDAALRDRSVIDFETVVFDAILASIHGSKRQTLVFLDACRNNPLPLSLQSSGSGSGLAQLQTDDDDVFVAFATQPGNTTRDGGGRHSPFTFALLQSIGKAGQSVSDLMIKVRNDVASATLGQQKPWDQSSLRSQFYFNPSPEVYVAEVSPGTTQTENDMLIKETFRASITLSSPDDVQEPTFTIRLPTAHGNNPVGAGRVGSVNDSLPSNVSDPRVPLTAERATAEMAAEAIASDQPQPTNSIVGAVEVHTPSAIRPAAGPVTNTPRQRLRAELEWFPDAGVDDTEKFASIDLNGLDDVVRPNRDASDGIELASVDPKGSNDVALPNQKATASQVLNKRELTVEIQTQLNRVGCSVGAVDGLWGPATARSALAFNRHSSASIDTAGPDLQSLDLLKQQNGSICKVCGRGTVEENGVCVAAASPAPDKTKKKVKKQVQAKGQSAEKRQAAEKKSGSGTATQKQPQTTIGSGIGVGSFF